MAQPRVITNKLIIRIFAGNLLRKLVLYPTELRGHCIPVIFDLSLAVFKFLHKYPANSHDIPHYPGKYPEIFRKLMWITPLFTGPP